MFSALFVCLFTGEGVDIPMQPLPLIQLFSHMRPTTPAPAPPLTIHNLPGHVQSSVEPHHTGTPPSRNLLERRRSALTERPSCFPFVFLFNNNQSFVMV